MATSITNSLYTTEIVDPYWDWVWNEGAEMVTNGDDNDNLMTWTGNPDSWTCVEDGAADITDGAPYVKIVGKTAGAEGASMYQDISLDPTVEYIFKYNMTVDTEGTMLVMMGQAATDQAVVGNMGFTVTGVGSESNIGYPDNWANTGISIVTLDTADTDMELGGVSVKPILKTWWPNGRRVNSISFTPGGVGDQCIFRDGGTENGAVCFDGWGETDMYDQKIKYFHGQRLKLFFDVSASTITPDYCRIIISWAE